MVFPSLRIKELTPADLATVSAGGETGGVLDAFRKEYAGCRSRPEWCFAAEQGGEVIGVLGYRASNAHRNLDHLPETLIIFSLQCSRNYLEVGQKLLEHSLSTLRSLGVSKVKWSFESAEFWGENPLPNPHWQQQMELAHHAGISLSQEKVNYVCRLSAAASEVPSCLIYRSLQEVGEAAYIEAIQKVMQGTLDRIDAALCSRLGLEQAARHFFDSLSDDLTYELHVWKLGYTTSGTFVGLIAPLKMWGGLGTFGYIGVVPEFRGKGYSIALIQKGHADLLAEGIGRVIADTDALNIPMQRTFDRSEYRMQGRSRAYEINF